MPRAQPGRRRDGRWQIPFRNPEDRVTHFWQEMRFVKGRHRTQPKLVRLRKRLPVSALRMTLTQARLIRPSPPLVRELRAAVAEECFLKRSSDG